ncbi:MAG: SH3 domain-containing protein [Clostridiales bacterium]|nr:SH3 domain-containing protein [Clostridiales bacterium]
MKKTLAVFILLVLTVTTVPVFAHWAEAVLSSEEGCVTLWDNPQGNILGEYYPMVAVTVLSNPIEPWVLIQIGEEGMIQGYVSADQLLFSSQEEVPVSEETQSLLKEGLAPEATLPSYQHEEAPPFPSLPTLLLDASLGQTTLWADPYGGGFPLATFEGDTLATILGFADHWYHVQAEGITGFVFLTPMAQSPSFEEGFDQTIAEQLPYEEDFSQVPIETPVFEEDFSQDPIQTPVFEEDFPQDPIQTPVFEDGFSQDPIQTPVFEEDFFDSSFFVVNNPNAADRLNLRDSPSSDAMSLGKYYNGAYGVLLAPPQEDGWCKVRIGNIDGYMKTQYLLFNADLSAAPAMPVVAIDTARNGSANPLNLRALPSQKSAIIGQYANGTPVTVFGITPKWYHVEVDGQLGFMMAEFLSPQLEYSGTAGSTDFLIDSYALVNNPDPADRLNLRVSPSRSANSLGKYYNGAKVTLLEPEEKGWSKVQIGTLEGYMESRYLAVNASEGQVPCAMPVLSVQNENNQLLNLRQHQSRDSVSLGLYESGTEVTVLGLTQSWYHVEVDGQLGFMMVDFLSPKLTY